MIFLSSAASSQEVLQITGRIVDAYTDRPIQNVHIVNLKKRTINRSDTAGFFYLTLLRSDILRFSALGYDTEYIAYADTLVDGSEIQTIRMTPKVYNIAEVDIYEARWKDFQFEFAHTKVEELEQKGRIDDWFHTVVSEEELKMLTAYASAGIPINYKSNRQKQLEKVEYLERRESDYELVAMKFNHDFVAQTTNLPDEEIEAFMKFCNFSRAFILMANKYDLIVEMKKRLIAYQKTQVPGF